MLSFCHFIWTAYEIENTEEVSVLLAAQTERDQSNARLSDELTLKSALLERAEVNAEEASKRAGLHADRLLLQTSLVEQRDAELVNMQAKLDALVVSHDQQAEQSEKELANVRAELEAANVSELEAVRLRLSDAEAEADELHAKLEAKESELEAVRLRLMDAEAESDKLRAQTATGSVNRDEEQVTRRIMERIRAIEAEVASKRWNEKSIEDMECRNEG